MVVDKRGLSKWQRFQKRSFDIVFSFLGLLFIWWIIVAAALLAKTSTRRSGFFKQERVGMHGVVFNVLKIRTMRVDSDIQTSVTTSSDSRITRIGAFLRKTKIDELPQLWNVLIGDMSFVGPRPDVCGFADKIAGSNRLYLTIRPGITGPASLKYRNEQFLLNKLENPERYNEEVLFPDKVKINIDYINNYSFIVDLKLIIRTIFLS